MARSTGAQGAHQDKQSPTVIEQEKVLNRSSATDVGTRRDCPTEQVQRPTWPVSIFGVACLLVRTDAGYAVRTAGKCIAEAPARFLAVARAAAVINGDAA